MDAFNEQGPLEGELPSDVGQPLEIEERNADDDPDDIEEPLNEEATNDEPGDGMEAPSEEAAAPKPAEKEDPMMLFDHCELRKELLAASGHKRKELFKYQKGKYSTIFMFMKHFPKSMKKRCFKEVRLNPNKPPTRLQQLVDTVLPHYRVPKISDRKPIFVVPYDQAHDLGFLEVIINYLRTIGDVMTPTIDKGGSGDSYNNVVINLFNRVRSYNWSSPESPVVLVGMSIGLSQMVECASKMVESPPLAIICFGPQIRTYDTEKEAKTIESIKVPIMFIVGEYDDELSMSSLAALRTKFVNSPTTTVVMGGCDHGLLMSEAKMKVEGLSHWMIFLTLVEQIRDYVSDLIAHKSETGSSRRRCLDSTVPETLLATLHTDVRGLLTSNCPYFVYFDEDEEEEEEEQEEQEEQEQVEQDEANDNNEPEKEEEREEGHVLDESKMATLKMLINDLFAVADIDMLIDLCKEIVNMCLITEQRPSLSSGGQGQGGDFQGEIDQSDTSCAEESEGEGEGEGNGAVNLTVRAEQYEPEVNNAEIESMMLLADDLLEVKKFWEEIYNDIFEALKILHQEKFPGVETFIKILMAKEKEVIHAQSLAQEQGKLLLTEVNIGRD